MKFLKSLTALVILVTAAVIFAGCGNAPVPADETTNQTAETTETPETPAEPIEFSDKYVIIVPENSDTDFQKLCLRLGDAINAATGIRMAVKDDFLRKGDSAGEYEIIIGESAREESEAVAATLRYRDFTVRAVGKKLVALGRNADGNKAAVEWLTEHLSEIFPSVAGDFRYDFKAEYETEDLVLCGRPVGSYKIIYPNNSPAYKTYAQNLSTAIAEKCGTVIPIYNEKNFDGEGNTISIGKTAACGCDEKFGKGESYCLHAEEGKISILAGGKTSYNSLFAQIVKIIKNSGDALTAEMLETTYSMPARDEYIANPESFVPIWKEIETPGPVYSFDEKIKMLTDPSDKRLGAVAHRAETAYYPENSAEAVISAYHAGALAVEIDMEKTKDGIYVLMHDTLLERMTDYAEKKGKTIDGITLPTSSTVSDWTLEQLRCLRLKTGKGGSGAGITDFLIPTLEEILILSKDRIFLNLDKTNTFNYIKDILPIMKKTGNYRSVLIGGTGVNYQTCVSYQKQVYNETGEIPLIYVRASVSAASSASSYLSKNSLFGNTIVLGSDFYVENEKAYFSCIKNLPATRFVAWTLEATPQTAEVWTKLYDGGVRIIMTDKLFDILKVAEKVGR